MTLESFRNYCLQKSLVTEEFPFGIETLVYKVNGKIFALTDVDKFDYINLKCDPELAIQLREQYHEIKPGYHMNKKHWNSVEMGGSLPDRLVKEWIDHSYNLAFKKKSSKR